MGMDRVIIHVSGSSVSGDILQWFCCDSSLPLNPSDCFEFLGSEPFPCGHPPHRGPAAAPGKGFSPAPDSAHTVKHWLSLRDSLYISRSVQLSFFLYFWLC